MNLAELQERYPIGSRWRVVFASGHTSSPYEVVAHHKDSGVILLDDLGLPTNRQPHVLDSQWERIPDPVPCPITEPVTLDKFIFSVPGRRGGFRYDGPSLALHPPCDGESFGRWTWEGGSE